jgi:hypothetical protein
MHTVEFQSHLSVASRHSYLIITSFEIAHCLFVSCPSCAQSNLYAQLESETRRALDASQRAAAAEHRATFLKALWETDPELAELTQAPL